MQIQTTERGFRQVCGAATWLCFGVALVVAANMRWGIAAFAWIAPVPWLRFLRTTRGLRSRLSFAAALSCAWILATAKIVTPPLPWAFALLGFGFAARELVGYFAWDYLRRTSSRGASVFAFAAVMAVLEWAQYRFTSLASWGGAAYTQVTNLPFLQLASVVGAVGAGFFVNWFAAGLEATTSPSERFEPRRLVHALTPLAAVLVIHAWGSLRLQTQFGSRTQVATVDTTASFGASPELPDASGRAQIVTTLLDDTRRAARRGAKLVVWTEAAALVFPDEEQAFIARTAAAARELRVHIAAAYIVPLQLDPLRYENKLSWFNDRGGVEQTYLKHHPVPGEPAVAGDAKQQAIATALGRAGVALCYDYDFPQLAREHAQLAIDLVALPSSDWQGIDPIHTQMAALRAIETGASVVRSTRFGLSAGIDALGRLHAARSSFAGGDRVRVFSLPNRRVATIYAQLGDLAVMACALLLAVLLASSSSTRVRRWGSIRATC